MPPSEVTFPTSYGIKLSGHLYVPGSYIAGDKWPAIAIAHPGGGVKEQTAGTYAQQLASQGFVTLAFDRATQGASDGTPRNVEDPYQAAEDIKSAVSYLSTHSEVDPQRIGLLGICAGGGYAIYATSTDRRVKALATVSMVDIAAMYRAIPEDHFEAAQVTAGEARNHYAKTGQVQYLPYLPYLPENVPPEAPQLMREAVDYYLTPRGGHSRSLNRMAAWSFEWFGIFEPFEKIEHISPRPLLLVAGDAADTITYSQRALAKANEPKELWTVLGASHVDLYDRKVEEVMPKLVEFFNKHL